MLVYRVQFSPSIEEETFEVAQFTNILFYDRLDSFPPDYFDIPDHQYMPNRYGVENNTFEIDYFKVHRTIWEQFIREGADYCLIIEEGVELYVPPAAFMAFIRQLPDDWELFFPFDKTDEKYAGQKLEIYASVFGFFWGSHAYLLSAQGAKKLLALKVIRQPLDEEMLQLSLQHRLNCYFFNIEAFAYDEAKSPSYIARRECLRDTIRNFSAWNQHDKEKARQLMKILSEAADTLGIPLVLHGGTLLGYIRHGGIMPWDDDIDFGIPCSQIYRFLEFIEKQGLVRYDRIFHVKQKSASWFYKFWLADGTPIAGYEYTFPFVDCWLYYEDGQHVWYEEGYFFPKKHFLPLQMVDFEGSLFRIPAMPLASLDGIGQFKLFECILVKAKPLT